MIDHALALDSVVIQCMGDIVDRVLEDYEDQGVMSSDPVLSVLV